MLDPIRRALVGMTKRKEGRSCRKEKGAVRAISLIISLLLLGAGIAACESDDRSGNANGSGYYSDQPQPSTDTKPRKPEGGGGY
jgi:hypothetical protein